MIQPVTTLPIEARHQHGDQSALDDRMWLEQVYLPLLEGDVLYVGVAGYTDFYHTLVKTPERFVTVDCEPAVARFGSPYGHYVSTLFDLVSCNGLAFDHISMHGVFGLAHSRTNNPDAIVSTINVAVLYLRSGGTLELGFSTNVLTVADVEQILAQADTGTLRPITRFICKPSSRHADMVIFWGRKP